jgi:hypothetical protein
MLLCCVVHVHEQVALPKRSRPTHCVGRACAMHKLDMRAVGTSSMAVARTIPARCMHPKLHTTGGLCRTQHCASLQLRLKATQGKVWQSRARQRTCSTRTAAACTTSLFNPHTMCVHVMHMHAMHSVPYMSHIRHLQITYPTALCSNILLFLAVTGTL